MPLFRALAKNMARMTNADESPTNRLTLFPIYLSLFIVSTLWYNTGQTGLISGLSGLLYLWSGSIHTPLIKRCLVNIYFFHRLNLAANPAKTINVSTHPLIF